MNSISYHNKSVIAFLCELPVGVDGQKMCCVVNNEFWFWENQVKYVIDLSRMRPVSINCEKCPSELSTGTLKQNSLDWDRDYKLITCISVLVAASLHGQIYCTMDSDYIVNMLHQIPKQLRSIGIQVDIEGDHTVLFKSGKKITWMEALLD